MDVLHVVGARPNFMKAAPVLAALGARPGLRQTLVHTGQHYDPAMSGVFFQQLGLPEPDVNLGVGSGTAAKQIAGIMTGLETLLTKAAPDLALVYGDVNSTLAAALTCNKAGVPVGHVEAGLRSFDRTMPEEINRVATDHMADLLFTPSSGADENLSREGISEGIHLVGNVMIDTLIRLLPVAEARWPLAIDGLPDLREVPFGLVTLHRPSNVDDPAALQAIMAVLDELHPRLPLVVPLHPRTRQRLCDMGLDLETLGPRFIEPLGYLEFLALERHAAVVVTDSGGVQEETTYLGVPCLTLRPNTERPITETMGTNTVVGTDPRALTAQVDQVLAGQGKQGKVPPLWDGQAARRIADVIESWAS